MADRATDGDLVFSRTDDGGASARVGDVEIVLGDPASVPLRALVLVWGGGVRPCETGGDCPCDPDADAGDDPPETCLHEIDEPVRTTGICCDGPRELREAFSLLVASAASDPGRLLGTLPEADGAAEIGRRTWVIDGIRHPPADAGPVGGHDGG
jgi:hypothetical protein